MTQNEALKILKAGHNVYLTGAAGSGKTYVLNEYIRFLKARGVGVGITASTGIAATHLGGITIHSWAGIGIQKNLSDEEIKAIVSNKRIMRNFARAEVLIIDEISMLDAGRLDLVQKVARFARGSFEPFGGMQVVLCGDFFQLPPIAKENESAPRFAYRGTAWKNSDLKICYLHEQYRQGDKDLLEMLGAIRQAIVGESVLSRLRLQKNTFFLKNRVTKLYSHNVNVDAENSRELARLPAKEKRYKMEARGVPAIVNLLKKGCLVPEMLTLKKDAVVIFVKNNFEQGYVNGTLGAVSGFDGGGYPVVKTLDGKEIVAAPASWSVEENRKTLAEIIQIPLRLAWAITIHKSQGMTLDAAEIDLSNAFEMGMGYVALSRVRSLSGMRLLGFNEMALKVNPEIIDFDIELQRQSKEAEKDLAALLESKKSVKETVKTYSVKEIKKTHPVAYEKWSLEDEKRLVAGFRAGQNVKMLDGVLGRSRGSIRSRIKKLGLNGE